MSRFARTALTWLLAFTGTAAFLAADARAQESIPGDACTTAGLFRQSSGASPTNSGYTLFCDGTRWVGMIEYRSTGDLYFSSTGAIALPDGTTAQRPAVPIAGMIRYNVTLDTFEGYVDDGTPDWEDLLGGGTASASAPDRGIQFNSGGAFAADALLVYSSTGDLGIGTATPGTKLDVEGYVNLGSDTNLAYGYQFVGRDDAGLFKAANFLDLYLSSLGSVRVNIDSNSNETDRVFSVATNVNSYTGGTELFRVQENGMVGVGTISPGALLHSNTTSTAGNTVLEALRLSHEDTNSGGAVNMGASMSFNLETATNATFAEAGRIETLWTDATANSKDSVMRFYTMGPNTSGATPIEHMRLNRGGASLSSDANMLFNAWYDAGGILRYIANDSAFGIAHNATNDILEIWPAGAGTAGNTVNAISTAVSISPTAVGINMPYGVIPSAVLDVRTRSTTGNTALEGIRIGHEDENTAGANNIGTYLSMTAESNSNGVFPEIARIQSAMYDAANGSKDSNLAFYTLGPNAGAGSNTATEKMVLDSGGNLAVDGVVSSEVALRFYNVVGPDITNQNSNSGASLAIRGGGAANSSLALQSTTGVGTSDYIGFYVGNNGATEGMRINTSGYVGILNNNPTVALDVTGDIEYTGTIADVSDRRLKKDIQNLMTGQLDKVLRLQGVSFKMIEDAAGRTELGLIAQDVQEIFPELVQESSGGTLSLNYTGLIAPMIEAMKEQQAQIEDLKAMNAALVTRIEALEARQ